MMKLPLTLATVLCASTIVGCVGEGDDDPDLELRAAEGPLWQPNPSYAGDGPISVRGGDDIDVPDTIIWDLDGGNVSVQLEPGLFATRMAIRENELWHTDALLQDVPVCTVVAGDHSSGMEFELVDADGEVVFTLWQRHVFAGAIDLPAQGGDDFDQLVEDELAFSFKKDGIHAGHWSDGVLLARASEDIDMASPVRRLLLAALVAGECGSDGMP